MSGEKLIQVLFRADGPPKQGRMVGWTTKSEDAEAFVAMLGELMESVRGANVANASAGSNQ